ncbi:hypothetical protein [Spartinivicinus ruber]|uniref:hypothetical protein n=1 Tax=Spartinivicinus ruber TaxID=2683272 RepID=UPI0013D64FEF|nr:hypothetical protein [Spartinivicinus ruber]
MAVSENNQNNDIDLSAVSNSVSVFDVRDRFGGGVTIDEGERLRFGKQVLCWLAVICIGVFIGYACYPENAALQGVFELVKIGALPLVTLVISFYFPSSNGTK